jgi:nitric oxide reductase activation protein
MRLLHLICILFFLQFSLICLAQNPPPRPTHPDLSAAPANEDDATERMAHDMAKKANEDRAAAIKSDTDKLLKLAVELKASVDKSNENVLSIDVIKKAEEIEKLAHSVKDKMKGPS